MNKPGNSSSLEGMLKSIFGEECQIDRQSFMSGSDLNQVCRLNLSTGEAVFVKFNTADRADMFRAEAEGLEAIRKTGCIPAPVVYGCGIDQARGRSFLLLEYLSERRGQSDRSWDEFGRNLAAMHQADTESFTNDHRYGFVRDNYIGLSPQKNAGCSSWIDFFRSRRLEEQLRKGAHYFQRAQLKQFSNLLDHLDNWLSEPDFPSLLHGDLWGGNAMPCSDGIIRLIDPAVYVGDREADLAMTELFGGFPEAFYRAYDEMLPIEPGYRDRRDLYNLYHLLNHLNLFGRGYLGEVLAVLARYVG